MTETTVEYARVRIQELSTQVDELILSLAKVRDENAAILVRIAEAKNYLSEEHEDLGDHAEHLASLLGVDLEVEREIEVTVNFTVTVATSPNEDAYSVANDLNFEVSSSWGSNIEISDTDYSIEGARWS